MPLPPALRGFVEAGGLVTALLTWGGGGTLLGFASPCRHWEFFRYKGTFYFDFGFGFFLDRIPSISETHPESAMNPY